MENQKRQIHVRLLEESYRKLKAKCAVEGTTIQDRLARLITNSLSQPHLAIQSKYGEKSGELDIIKVLQECPILSTVDRLELEKLAKFASILHFGRGAIIVLDEETPTKFHIIKDGIVKVFKTSQAGKEFTIDIRYRGEIIGLIPVIKGIPHFASTRALADTEIVAISRQDFLDFIDRNPAVASRITDSEFQRICDLHERLMGLMADNASRRLVKTLFALFGKYGSTLHFTHQEIAEMSGISTETATRIMTQLKNSGILKSARGKLIITNAEKLRL